MQNDPLFLDLPKGSEDERYMERCLRLAILAGGKTLPNPLVGSVLVHDGKIIGEGYHREYGGPHAEVACLASVKPEDENKISASTLYVSLEPCSHFGKTPPCADMIVRKKIKKVVIGCLDPFVKVDGRGIKKLLEAGVETVVGVLEKQCREVNERFFTYHLRKRPFFKLKWAKTADGFIASNHGERLVISNPATNRLVHKWRSEEQAILIGHNTALLDDPMLNNRYWSGGSQPVRIVIDPQLKLPEELNVFKGIGKTTVLNHCKEAEMEHLRFIMINPEESLATSVSNACLRIGIQSVLVEGGRSTLKAFLDANLWDKVNVIVNTKLFIGSGISAPVRMTNEKLMGSDVILEDRIDYFSNTIFQVSS